MDFQENIVDREKEERTVTIKIIGVGGGGCNAINRLVKAKVQGVTFIAANTDKDALLATECDISIQLGAKRTHGLGAGSKPQIGKEAAEESASEIKDAIKDANLLFITAGMGGGTGTGASPVIASIAKELGILTIAIVTKPFNYELRQKMENAEKGIAELRKYCDVLLVIPNQKVYDYVKTISANKKEDGAMLKLMQIADNVLHSSIVGITNLIVKRSIINTDFADLCTVIKGKGTAHIGVGSAEGEGKVVNAVSQAASSPLLESNFEGATQILISITGDVNMSMLDIEEAMTMIGKVVSPDCNIIQGIGFDDKFEDRVEVTIVATGFNENPSQGPVFNVNKPASKGNNLVPDATSFSLGGNPNEVPLTQQTIPVQPVAYRPPVQTPPEQPVNPGRHVPPSGNGRVSSLLNILRERGNKPGSNNGGYDS